jgi:predicted metal-dependent hydrolase
MNNGYLQKRTNKYFLKKLTNIAKFVDVKPKRIVIKNLKNRWGSINKNNTINLNVNLLKAPEDIIDYVIIHELCHLNIKGHSYHFWDYLKQIVPDYKQKID